MSTTAAVTARSPPAATLFAAIANALSLTVGTGGQERLPSVPDGFLLGQSHVRMEAAVSVGVVLRRPSVLRRRSTSTTAANAFIVVSATRRAFPYRLPFVTHQFLLGDLYVGMEEAASVVVVAFLLLEVKVVLSLVVVVIITVVVGIVFRFGRFGSTR